MVEGRNCHLCGLTFELTWRQRRDTKPALQIMHTCTVARALWHAVGSQVERGVRRRWCRCVRAIRLTQDFRFDHWMRKASAHPWILPCNASTVEYMPGSA